MYMSLNAIKCHKNVKKFKKFKRDIRKSFPPIPQLMGLV